MFAVIGYAQLIKELQATVPTGYSIVIGGEYAKQQTGFGELGIILLISCLMIYVALVIQFNSAIKPILVFVLDLKAIKWETICTDAASATAIRRTAED